MSYLIVIVVFGGIGFFAGLYWRHTSESGKRVGDRLQAFIKSQLD